MTFRLDGIAEQPVPAVPRSYVEFQFQPDNGVYPRFSAKPKRRRCGRMDGKG